MMNLTLNQILDAKAEAREWEPSKSAAQREKTGPDKSYKLAIEVRFAFISNSKTKIYFSRFETASTVLKQDVVKGVIDIMLLAVDSFFLV